LHIVKRLFLLAGAALLGVMGFVAVAPSAEAAPLVCVKVGFGTAPSATIICLPPA
jgi:hypothetical protein